MALAGTRGTPAVFRGEARGGCQGTLERMTPDGFGIRLCRLARMALAVFVFIDA
jgi:hypothetical protein